MSENTPNELLEKLKNIGITNLQNPSAEDVLKILNATLKSKEIDADVFKNYMNYVTPQVKVLFDGLQTFVQSQEKISKSVIDIISNAINILGRELEKDLTNEERKTIRDEISKYIEQARIESDKHRNFIKELTMFGGVAVMLVIVAGVYVVTKGKSKEVLTKGVQMVGKAF